MPATATATDILARALAPELGRAFD